MNGDRLSELARTDPGLTEALWQVGRGGLRDGSGPDPLHNADVLPEVLSEFLTHLARQVPDQQVFGLAVTLPGLIHRRGAGQEALDVLLAERTLTPSQRRVVDENLTMQRHAALERGGQPLITVPPMDDDTRAATMQALESLHSGAFDPGGQGDAADLFTQLVQHRTVSGMRVLRAAVHARIAELVSAPATGPAALHYLGAALQVEYLYADELAQDMRRADVQLDATQTEAFDLAVQRLTALVDRIGPSPL